MLPRAARASPTSLKRAGKDTPFDKLSVPAKIRLAMLGNAFDRAKAIRDPIKLVAVAAIKAGGVTEFEAAGYASNPGLPEEVIKYIAQKRDWTKAYGVKFSLCRNPKTPITEAMRLLPFLREKDLQRSCAARACRRRWWRRRASSPPSATAGQEVTAARPDRAWRSRVLARR